MQPGSVASSAVLNVALSLALLGAGVGGGAAFGLLNGSSAPATSVPDATNHIAAFTQTDQFDAGGLRVEEAPPARAAVRKTVRRMVTQSGGAESAAGAAGGAGAGTSMALSGSLDTAGSANCARLDDAKIQWLLNLVGKARSSNPDQAGVAAGVERQLHDALGKNMCAEEAQIYIGNMCADRAVKNFMGLMVKELPFFVRPLVGDPCKQDLVAAAEKYLR